MFSTAIAVIALIATSFLLIVAGMYRASAEYRKDNAIAGMFGTEVRVFTSARCLFIILVWVIAGIYLFG